MIEWLAFSFTFGWSSVQIMAQTVVTLTETNTRERHGNEAN
jgi:hypothetical protein